MPDKLDDGDGIPDRRGGLYSVRSIICRTVKEYRGGFRVLAAQGRRTLDVSYACHTSEDDSITAFMEAGG